MRKIFLTCLLTFLIPNAWCEAKDGTSQLDRYRYQITYPNTWQPHDDNNGTIVFIYPIPNTKLTAMVNIQSIYTKAGGGKYKSVKDLMDDFLIQVPMHTVNAKLFDRKPYTQPGAPQLTGEQIYVTFKQGNQTYKQWQIMLVTADGNLFQNFAYRAPQQYYDAYFPAASQMLESWQIR